MAKHQVTRSVWLMLEVTQTVEAPDAATAALLAGADPRGLGGLRSTIVEFFGHWFGRRTTTCPAVTVTDGDGVIREGGLTAAVKTLIAAHPEVR